MYPIRFEPIYKTYLWGGNRIATLFNRKISEPKVAESWEISDRDDGMSICINGPSKGKTLNELVHEMKDSLLGVGRTLERFPILTKIIDAKENLSIQVHPDMISGPKLNGEPKSEMWVALDDSTVYGGIEKGINEKTFRDAIKDETAEKLLTKVELKKGESIFLPGGRVHSICSGSLIYEIQQNSNTTYRLYDWGRGRELHLEKGMQAIRWDNQVANTVSPRNLSSDLYHQLRLLVFCEFFVVERIDIFNSFHIAPIPKSFQMFFCLQGEPEFSVDGNVEKIKPGVTILAPAACKTIDIKGKCQLLRIRLP